MDIKLLYPSFTRKALTFTIDDGNFKYDEMLLRILKPVGIKGTFNLCSNLHVGKADYTREFYRGYGIANHCKHHPFVKFDGVELMLSEDEFDENTADPSLIYRVKDKEGFYWQIKPNGWRQMVLEDDFIRYVKEGLDELNAIFGEGTVRDYVWPYGYQPNALVNEFINKTHRSSRKTGCTLDTAGFAIPADKCAWSYNANHMNLIEVMEKYEAYPDDGELKFFAFGVHSIDFERDGKWDDLKTFAEKYGNRPDTYWYASVEEIFDYEEATKALVVTENSIENPTDIDVYLELNGKKVCVKARSAMDCNSLN